jgi:hypothetical protein
VSLLATGQPSGRIEPDALAAMQPSASGASVAMDGLICPAMLVFSGLRSRLVMSAFVARSGAAAVRDCGRLSVSSLTGTFFRYRQACRATARAPCSLEPAISVML